MGVARAPVAGSGCAPACSESVSKGGVLGLVIAQSRQGRRLGCEGRAIWYRIGQRVAQRQRHMGNAHGQRTRATHTGIANSTPRLPPLPYHLAAARRELTLSSSQQIANIGDKHATQGIRLLARYGKGR